MKDTDVTTMTSSDFRRLAREAGEMAQGVLADGTASINEGALAERLHVLASALCEVDARTGRGEIRATIVGGPIEMRDYNYLQLEQDHTAVRPDGGTVELPPGTKLVRHQGGGGIGVKQPHGLSSKTNRDDYLPAPEA